MRASTSVVTCSQEPSLTDSEPVAPLAPDELRRLLSVPSRRGVGPTVRAAVSSVPGGLALVVGASLVCLLLIGLIVDLRELKVRGLASTLNDQVGYIAAARNLVDTGHLQSHLIYPSLLTQAADKSYLYMPGYYLALALTYIVFGFGAVQSALPSMVAYVVAGIALFLSALRLYGRDTATIATLLFLFFPANIVFAVTAMAEMTLIAAALVAFAIFVHLPFTWRVGLGPLLLVLPLMVRETGIVIAIPFAFMIWAGGGTWRTRAAVLFALLSTLVVALVLRSDIANGRPSFTVIELFSKDERLIYGDAFLLQHLQPTLTEWLVAPIEKLVFNARQLAILAVWTVRTGRDLHSDVASLEVVSLILILAGIPVSAVACLRRPRDPIPLAALAVSCVLLVAILSLYFVLFFQAVRHLLLAVPFECLAAASPVGTAAEWPAPPRRPGHVHTTAVAGRDGTVVRAWPCARLRRAAAD